MSTTEITPVTPPPDRIDADAHPVVSPPGPLPPAPAIPQIAPRIDRCAVASAICGITAFVPILSQLAGLILGIMAIRRIRQARHDGLHLPGLRWAIVGIATSVGALLCWLLILVMFGLVISIFSQTGSALDQAIPSATD